MKAFNLIEKLSRTKQLVYSTQQTTDSLIYRVDWMSLDLEKRALRVIYFISYNFSLIFFHSCLDRHELCCWWRLDFLVITQEERHSLLSLVHKDFDWKMKGGEQGSACLTRILWSVLTYGVWSIVLPDVWITNDSWCCLCKTFTLKTVISRYHLLVKTFYYFSWRKVLHWLCVSFSFSWAWENKSSLLFHQLLFLFSSFDCNLFYSSYSQLISQVSSL